MYKGRVVLYTLGPDAPAVSHTHAATFEDKVIYFTPDFGNNGIMSGPINTFYTNPRELIELEKIIFDIDKLLESASL